MNKKTLKVGIMFFIILAIIFSINIKSYAGTLSSDINGINDSKYPGIKSQIQSLQKKHGNYKFQVYYTGIDWTEAVTMEYQGHGKSPNNLFSKANNRTGKWFCPICGSKTYDSGWYCASKETIEYMMDPRNSLNEDDLFQFKNLETSDVSAQSVQAVINSKYGSYSYINNSTAINAITNASSKLNLNGFSILAKIINEQGQGTSPLATGKGYNGQYVGYYNFFNVGAYGNGTSTVILNGLKYAQNKGWNSVANSIYGGSEYYKSQYIGKGQNTLYYQRFNMVYGLIASHQYQQDVMGAQTSGTFLKSYYTASSTISSVNHTFIIPLYENMPNSKCARPSTTENSVLNYEDATVTTDKLAVRAAPNSSRIISYLSKNEKIKVLTRATSASSDGNYWDIIVSNTYGTYGYVLRSGISAKIPWSSYVFDYKYYADNNSDVKKVYGYNEYNLYQHFINYGIKEGRSSSPVFNAKYYLENNADLKKLYGTDYISACNHFNQFGYKEYRKSAVNYDGFFYKYYYGDLTGMDSSALIWHYTNFGRFEGRLGGLSIDMENVMFDANVYTSINDDLRAAFGNNLTNLKRHWLQFGIAEGRISSYMYDPGVYSAMNPDLQKAFGNNNKALFQHFVQFGINEKRYTSLVFDVSRYLSLNKDIQNAFKTNYPQIYLHFKNFGIKEGRNASLVFDVYTYVNSSQDLKSAFGNNYNTAIWHFYRFGIGEGRKTSSNFNLAKYMQYSDLRNAFGKDYKQYYIHYLRFGINEKRKAI